MLDAGHGLHTAGKETPFLDTIGRKIKEAEQNYPIMFMVQELLRQNGIDQECTNVNIGYDMPLDKRVEKCDASGDNYIVSIHKDAWNPVTGVNEFNSANGTTTFCYKFGGEGEDLARLIHKHVIKLTGDTDRGVKEGNFQIIRDPDASGVLIECGFMTNYQQANEMLLSVCQMIYARGIAMGICEYEGVEYNEPSKPEDIEEVENVRVKAIDDFTAALNKLLKVYIG